MGESKWRRLSQSLPLSQSRAKGKRAVLADRLGVEACKFIQKKNKDKPFFLYLSHYSVHTPIQGPSKLKKKYEAKKPTERHKNAAYAAMIESTDDSVGSVLGKLEELGLSDNTIVLFFSDNGGHGGVTSNAPLRGSKGMLYEVQIREPMIVKWPGVTKPGSVCRGDHRSGLLPYPAGGNENPCSQGLPRRSKLGSLVGESSSQTQKKGLVALSSLSAGIHRSA